MRTKYIILAALMLTVSCQILADTHYVDISNTTPSTPYTTWGTAAANIQDAVAAAISGDTVLVADGMYDTGGAVTPGYSCMNRVVITKEIVVQSVNGPDYTVIVGAEATGGGNGADAVRGVYMNTGTLSGFTVTNGHTRTSGSFAYDRSGGGVNLYNGSGTVTNCALAGNSSSCGGGGVNYGTLNHCTLSDNSAGNGGGSYYATLNNCTLSGNSANYGGGSYNGMLNYCTISGNLAAGMNGHGGGSYKSSLSNCTLTANSASSGGGSSDGTLINCTLSGNSALNCGGNSGGTLKNCVLSHNTATYRAGGSSGGTLNNCTITGNSATYVGGCYGSTLTNCIVYHNTSFGSDKNWKGAMFSYCCTTPDPGGTGNITDDPMLLSGSHIHADSPCAGAGSVADVSGKDIDGEAWATPPSIGCDEPLSPFTGELSVSISAEHKRVVSGYTLSFSAKIVGEASSNHWTFGDGTLVSNTVHCSHSWTPIGTYDVIVTAYNDTYPGGISATVQVQVVPATIHYADADNATPVFPYTSWAMAAATIQDAVDAAALTPGTTVLVADGTYDTGSAVTPGYSCLNRVAITNDITVRSVNGPDFTFILGAEATGGGNGVDAVRGAYMSAGLLSGFTVSNGHTLDSSYALDGYGGGINLYGGDGTVSNCVLSGNSAEGGGGSCYGTLNNCIITDNSADVAGGSRGGTLNHCTITGNSAGTAGGCRDSTLNYCIISDNVASDLIAGFATGGGCWGGTLNHCTITGNSVLGTYGDGGGCAGNLPSPCTLNDCTISSNSATRLGGGTYECTLNNCVITGNSASGSGGSRGGILSNCTISNNSAGSAGGCSSATLTNCIISGNSATSSGGGGSIYCTLDHCTISGNSAVTAGGGNSRGTLNHCTLTGNFVTGSSGTGGGSYWGTLNHCTLTGNSVTGSLGEGGGIYQGTLNNCTLSGNSTTRWGGGSFESTLNNCIISGNNSAGNGGGSYGGALNNCSLTGNSANYSGGGSYGAELNNCTISANSVTGLFGNGGGGSCNGTLYNCIIYHNTSFGLGDNWSGGSFSYSCTTPDPGGVGNITADPMLLSASHIHVDSPCVGAGSIALTSETDIDGEAWAAPPSIGCDEPSAPFTGELSVAVSAEYTTIATGYSLSFAADIQGEIASILWIFGDEETISNELYDISHAWTSAGSFDVILTAYNDTYPGGIASTAQVQVVSAEIHYVDADSTTPTYPYTSWDTAADNIQDAADAATSGETVLVASGMYDDGETVTPGYSCINRVVITNDIFVQSVNGTNHTFIIGSEATGGGLGTNAVRGVYMRAGTLSGFTITNGHTQVWGPSYYDNSGGGVNMYGGSGIVSNCVLTGNSAEDGGGSYHGTLNDCTLSHNSAERGGGSYEGTLNRCTLAGNSVSGSYAGEGGGSYRGTLNNCTFTANSASDDGGGSNGSILNNCILAGNSAGDDGGGSYYGTLNNCTLVSNSASDDGGGNYSGTLRNCIVYHNSTTSGSYSNYYPGGFSYSCTAPQHYGTGNISADPMFKSLAAGNYRLAEGSLCINVGNNGYAAGSIDLDGNPRIIDGTVDMGAYEYGAPPPDGDTDGDGLPDWWELQYYGGVTNAYPSAICSNGVNTALEAYIAGFDPTDPEAGFAIGPVEQVPEGFVVSWNSVTSRVYDVLWTPSLDRGFQILETGIEYPINSHTDTVHSASSCGYYMVSVRMPGSGDADGDGLPDAWEAEYFASSVAAIAGYDFDGDGQRNIEEYIAGTDPTNAASFFKVDQMERAPAGTIIQWVSVTGRVYSVLWSPSPADSFEVLQSGIEYPRNSCTDTVHTAENQCFYNVEVQLK